MKRRPRLSAADREHIRTAMDFVLAGEWPFDDPDLTEEENIEAVEAFKRTYDKV